MLKAMRRLGKTAVFKIAGSHAEGDPAVCFPSANGGPSKGGRSERLLPRRPPGGLFGRFVKTISGG